MKAQSEVVIKTVKEEDATNKLITWLLMHTKFNNICDYKTNSKNNKQIHIQNLAQDMQS